MMLQSLEERDADGKGVGGWEGREKCLFWYERLMVLPGKSVPKLDAARVATSLFDTCGLANVRYVYACSVQRVLDAMKRALYFRRDAARVATPLFDPSL